MPDTPWPDRLLAYRRQNGLSQRQAGANLGVPRHSWARWERGEAVPRGLYAVALDRLLNRKGEEK